jgi:hypothetical protein
MKIVMVGTISGDAERERAVGECILSSGLVTLKV